MTSEQARRVLVVDDNPEIREILLTALRRRSLVVDQARDGVEAISLLREHKYAVVLLDLLMPNVDGFGVLDAIDHEPHPPVVLVVTAADASAIKRAESRRIHGIVRKPFDPAEIAQIVADCAELRGPSALETMVLATMGASLIALFDRM